MSLDQILLLGLCAILLWVLIGAIRTGEFRNYERAAGVESRLTLVRRDTNPAGFWILATGHVIAIIIALWWAFIR